MSKVDYDEQFERLWYENKHRLLNNDREYREEVERYKMTSGADWLLFGIPAVVGIVSFEMITFESEMMRWGQCTYHYCHFYSKCVCKIAGYGRQADI